MPLQPAFRPGARIALMDKFGTPWSGHGENLPVAFTGRNKNHGSFDHSPARDPKLDLLFERSVDAPRELVWKAYR